MHVAVYARISRDQEGRAEGVATQEAHGRRYATDRWPDLPVVTYSDNDLSASNGDHRPGFAALLDAIRRGEVARVVCAEQSRITREPAVWESFMVTMAKAGIDELHTYRKGTVAIRGSKMVGRILAAVDAEEAERIKARVAERHAALRAEGRPRGGLEYGYRPGRNDRGEATLVVQADEAAVVREVAGLLLAGWTLGAVAREMNARGITTVHGKRWGTSTVSRLMRKPTIAGLRDVGVPGTWEPIIDVDTWEQVRAVLGSRVATRATARRKFLLTGGIATCGRCGGRMSAQHRATGSGPRRADGRRERTPRYFCKPAAPDAERPEGATDEWPCMGVSIMADAFEAHVVAMLLDELDKPGFIDALTDDEHEAERARVADELRGVELRRAELARLVAAGEMTTVEWREARAVLDADQNRLSRELADLPAPVVGIDPAVIRAGWDAMTLDEQRAIVEMFVERVVVSRARPGLKRYDPDRVDIVWRTA